MDALTVALPWPGGAARGRAAAIRRARAPARWVIDERARGGTVLVEDRDAGTRTELLQW